MSWVNHIALWTGYFVWGLVALFLFFLAYDFIWWQWWWWKHRRERWSKSPDDLTRGTGL